jgi:hypothetical protein
MLKVRFGFEFLIRGNVEKAVHNGDDERSGNKVMRIDYNYWRISKIDKIINGQNKYVHSPTPSNYFRNLRLTYH